MQAQLDTDGQRPVKLARTYPVTAWFAVAMMLVAAFAGAVLALTFAG